MKNGRRIRARNLRDNDIADIVGVLDGWTAKLTWESLAVEVERRMHAKYTRQTLSKHERIRNAFLECKRRGRAKTPDDAFASPELAAALSRIGRLEAEATRLNNENDGLLEQFARWAYNAHLHGMTKSQLNQPLPMVNRGRSRPTTPDNGISKRGTR